MNPEIQLLVSVWESMKNYIQKKDRVEDALNATRAAIDEGIIPGGGVALMHAVTTLDIVGDNSEQTSGIDIVRHACEATFRAIMANAGLTADVIWNNIKSEKGRTKNTGFDARG